MKRRIFSFLLAVVMVFSLAPSVFAAEGDSPVVVMTADKTSVKPGENVTITYSLDHDLPEMTRLNIGVTAAIGYLALCLLPLELELWTEYRFCRARGK